MKRKYLRCHESQNDGDYLLNVEMHGAKGRGYQAMYFGGREFAECFRREFKVNAIHREEFAVLLHETVLGLGQHTHKIVLGKFAHRGDYGEASRELRYQAELHQVFWPHALNRRTGRFTAASADANETDHGPARAFGDDLVETDECAAADEENV